VKNLLIIFAMALTILLMSVSQAGCNNIPEIPEAPPEVSIDYPYRISLEDAGVIMGAPLPLPAYLPEGYSVTGIFMLEHNDYSEHMVMLIYNEVIDEKQLSDIQNVPWKIKMNVTLYRKGQVGGLKLVGEWFKISGTDAVLMTRENTNDLRWLLPHPEHPGEYSMKLSAIKDIPKEELLKIAESVTWK
jgi:hypothetical protein